MPLRMFNDKIPIKRMAEGHNHRPPAARLSKLVDLNLCAWKSRVPWFSTMALQYLRIDHSPFFHYYSAMFSDISTYYCIIINTQINDTCRGEKYCNFSGQRVSIVIPTAGYGYKLYLPWPIYSRSLRAKSVSRHCATSRKHTKCKRLLQNHSEGPPPDNAKLWTVCGIIRAASCMENWLGIVIANLLRRGNDDGNDNNKFQ
jgi:hypothetical protein